MTFCVWPVYLLYLSTCDRNNITGSF